jgi:hypothetical protein
MQAPPRCMPRIRYGRPARPMRAAGEDRQLPTRTLLLQGCQGLPAACLLVLTITPTMRLCHTHTHTLLPSRAVRAMQGGAGAGVYLPFLGGRSLARSSACVRVHGGTNKICVERVRFSNKQPTHRNLNKRRGKNTHRRYISVFEVFFFSFEAGRLVSSPTSSSANAKAQRGPHPPPARPEDATRATTAPDRPHHDAAGPAWQSEAGAAP